MKKTMLFFILFYFPVVSAMSSSNYQIGSISFNGGVGDASSVNYLLSDVVVGQPISTQDTSSGNYTFDQLGWSALLKSYGVETPSGSLGDSGGGGGAGPPLGETNMTHNGSLEYVSVKETAFGDVRDILVTIGSKISSTYPLTGIFVVLLLIYLIVRVGIEISSKTTEVIENSYNKRTVQKLKEKKEKEDDKKRNIYI